MPVKMGVWYFCSVAASSWYRVDVTFNWEEIYLNEPRGDAHIIS